MSQSHGVGSPVAVEILEGVKLFDLHLRRSFFCKLRISTK